MPAATYTPPPWSSLPPVKYVLEVIREGAVLASKPIDAQPHYVLGREPSSAQVVLLHPSVSRAHAVIQHSAVGEVYVRDLGSTHGTTLNRKRLPPDQFVRLLPGAVLRLGSSSRALTLVTPPEVLVISRYLV